jgi:CRP-like cAMP-binding protein
LLDGELDVIRSGPSGEELLATMRQGAFVGQIALVDRGPRSATVRARTDAWLLELSRETFERLLHARTSLALRFQDQIAIAGIRQYRMALARLQTLVVPEPAKSAASSVARTTAQGEAKPAAPALGEQERALAYIRAATSEWGLALEDVRVVEHEHRPRQRPRS